jgi:ubiquinone/menaquinone biosynthesis C-methylase UbiE
VYDLHNVSLHTGYAENMPFESNSFDLIVSNNGLNNVFDIEKVLNECFRLMKAGAKLIFTVNLPETMQEFYTVFEKVLTDRGLTDVSVLLHQHIAFKRKSIVEWKQLTTKHHLKLDMVEENQFCFRYADGSAMMKHSFIQLAFMESWKEIIPDVEKEEIFREIEEQLNRISEENGGLVMTIPYACIVLKKE